MTNNTTIRVSDYYGHPEFYPFMPNDLFASLESAFLSGDEFALVDAGQLESMMMEYQTVTK